MTTNEIRNSEIPIQDRKEGWHEVSLHDHTRTTSEDATGTRRIPLTKGKFALVDAVDFEHISKRKWHISSRGYAARATPLSNGKRSLIGMHRIINNTPDGMHTDHINGDKLDNRKCNLRTATASQNLQNQGNRVNNTSGYKGVHFHHRSKMWHVRIRVYGKRIWIGQYLTAELAYDSYRTAALRLHGEFANVMPEQESK